MPDIWMDVDTALSEVPINKHALTDDTDFKSREESVVYNQAGLDLLWNFVTSAGAFTQTAVTPTDTGGAYDWVNQGNGYYTIEIPASGGASINNDTEGYGWFSGYATGILPWSGPVIGFRAAALNDALCDGGDVLDVNVTQWLGTAAATPTTAGVPEVDVTHVSGTAQTAGDIVDLINSLPQAEVVYYPTTATRVTGDNDGGTVASMQTEDGVYFATGEVTTGTFLDVTLEFDTGDTTNSLQYAKIIGYYLGSGSHVVNIYRWNYVLGTWGVNIAATMRPLTGDDEYFVPLFERHISAGVVKLRFIHAGSVSGIGNHVLNLDMVRLVFAPVNGDLQTAVAEIYSLLQDVDSGVDKMADTIWDEILEGTETGRQMMRLFRAVLLGVSTGEGKTFLNAAGTSARVSALLDGLGNRTSVTTDAS